ncbi:Signal transduction histidine kinase [Reichenbachiella faecimaris]|uniref:histidine kinase n=1 Tax=Reichenbachiella faecimaris TaxID=692418 RepID=A0A1W2G618_REIFA|nr:sensor histidine kinase [Reichenbachiella faecimaris]SMD31736.1 Signal transduction histidine kinase [Reichenbachiella faecimaris]
MRLLLVFLVFSFFVTVVAKGQGSTFDPKEPIQNFSLTQWTAEDGLSSNNLTNVFQDSRGLLWVTSFNGVMIYDGERIEVYDINNLDLLETDGFYTVVEDDDGVIYLGSQGSSIISYSNSRFSELEISSGSLPKSVPSLLVSKSGTLYVGSNNQGLFKLENGIASQVDVPMLNKSTISNIKEDGEGKLWVATEGQGLFGLRDEQVESHYSIKNGLLDDYVESLICTSNGYTMVATTQGLQFVDDHGQLNEVKGLTNVYINYLQVDEWNSVWAGTENGLARWSPMSDKVDWVYGKSGIDLVRISSIIKDEENSLWLTSSRTGLMRLKESQLSNLTQPNISSNRVNIIHESWNGKLYIGTDQNLLDIYDGSSFSKLEINTDLGGNGVRDIYHDRDGSLWLATYVGIIHKMGNRETLYSTANGMPANNFRTVIKDKNGFFWFGSRSGGLVKFADGQILEILNNQNKLESNFILSATESKNGDLYIGTHSGGMTILKPSGQTITYHLKEDDSGVLLFNIDLISDSEALITANIGLIHFYEDSLRLIDLAIDQRSKTYFDLVDDEKENFWMTSNLGILQIEKSQWKQYRDGKIEELPYILLDENDGMNNKECTGATRSLLTAQGKIMIPTLGGVCEVNPTGLKDGERKPRLCIRNVLVDSESLRIDEDQTVIEAGALRYIFEFAVLSYAAPERNQFRYNLEGFEKEWSDPVYDGRVEYTNLPPGKYTFKVIGANESNIWNTEPVSFTFRVKPFFYQTIWFYLLVVLFIIGLFLIIYKWRISFINRQNIELKKVNAELDRFVYSASHEIRSPLASILGLINLARMGEVEKQHQYFDHIEKSVNRLDDFIQDIVDYSRNARLGIEVDEVDFETTISNILADISHTKNFDIIRCNTKYTLEGKFYSDSKRLKVVLSNIITNAFKHHTPDRVDDPFVSIEVSNVKKDVKIQVVDNGPGIEKKDQSKVFNMFYRATTASEGSGLGLYIVEETLEKIHGIIEIQSKKDEGTSFVITLRNLAALHKK